MPDGLAELLRRGAVELEIYPFARALAELWRAKRSGTVVLRVRQLEKRILFDSGVPVYATSNVAEESLGRSLVRRGEVPERLMLRALSKSIERERFLGEVLVAMKALTPYQLFRAMRRCFATCILDAFRWDTGELAFDANVPDVEGKVLLKINPTQLVMRGVSAFSPVEPIFADLKPGLTEAFVIRPEALAPDSPVSFNTIESRVTRHLQTPVTVGNLAKVADVDFELALRLVYALSLLGFVVPAGAAADAEELAAPEAGLVPASEPPSDTPAPKLDPNLIGEEEEIPVELEPEPTPAPEPAVALSQTLSEEEANAIDEAYLKSKSQDYFELLGVPRDVLYGELKHQFLVRVGRFNPFVYRGFNLGERADYLEEIFLALVHAFAALSHPETRARYVERLRDQDGRKKQLLDDGEDEALPLAKDALGKTETGDAKDLLQNGVKYLLGKHEAEALEQFRLAVAAAPQDPDALAYYGYTLFLVDPRGHFTKALHFLQKALSADPRHGSAYFFLGRIFELRQDRTSAWSAYAQCLQREPEHKDAQDAMQRLRTLRQKMRVKGFKP